MSAQLCASLVALSLLATPDSSSEWDQYVEYLIKGHQSLKTSKPAAYQQMGRRFETLFRSHPLSHIQIHHEADGKLRLMTAAPASFT